MDVDARLRSYLARKSGGKGSSMLATKVVSVDDGNVCADEAFYVRQEPVTPNSVVLEKVRRRKSLQLRNKQMDWQVYKMLTY